MNESRARERVSALRDFYRHLGVYIAVNLGLFLINITTNPGELWFHWPLMGWGIAVVLNALRVSGLAAGARWERRKIDELMQRDR